MFCTKCGKENKDDANFCAYCGMAIAKEQTSTSSRGVTTKCCICGKELSPSEVRFASSTSFKPCCLGCVGKTLAQTDTPKAYDEVPTEVGRRLRDSKRAWDAYWAYIDAKIDAVRLGQAPNKEQAVKAEEEALLAMAKFVDEIPGGVTKAKAKPMPDLTTEAGLEQAANQLSEFFSIMMAETHRLNEEIKTHQT